MIPSTYQQTPWDLLYYEAVSRQSQFREDYVVADPLVPWQWGTYAGRLLRYRLNWALCDGSSYSDLHLWSRQMRKRFGVYRWSRPIFTPGFRIMEFHATHIWGGGLDLKGGDGRGIPTALPIVDVEERLRPMIGKVWRDSNWPTKKDRVPRWAAGMGDAAIEIVDDPNKRTVKLRAVHPAHLAHVVTDDEGNVREYDLIEFRPDPEPESEVAETAPYWPLVRFTKKVRRDGDTVIFTTYREDEPYDWRTPFYRPGDREVGSKWTEEYGFTPLVLVKHLDVGFDWGWAEIHPAVARAREADDLGSILTDQTRRILNSPWLMNARKPSAKVFKVPDQTSDEFETSLDGGVGISESTTSGVTTITSRDRMQLIWVDPQQNNGKPANGQQLVGAMPIADIGAHIDRLMAEMEKDFPELRLDGETTGDSGRARRLAQSRAIAKVHARRPSYDDALVRAHMMALSMGGALPGKKPYPGFEGIDRNSFANGDLYHMIGDRSVMQVDQMDLIEEEQARLTALRTAKEAGTSVADAMDRLGYAADVVNRQRDREAQADALAQQLAVSKATQVHPGGLPGNVPPNGSKPAAQESVAAQNRGAAPPTDGQAPYFTRPGVPGEVRPAVPV